MGELIYVIEGIADFTAQSTEEVVKKWIDEKNYNMGSVMNAFRLLIVGTSRGPHLFDIIAWIGKEETIRRISRGLEVIGR